MSLFGRKDEASVAPSPELGRDENFMPGDIVRIAIKPGGSCREFNGQEGVVAYPRDNEDGWLIKTSLGHIRCVASELTMLVRRLGL